MLSSLKPVHQLASKSIQATRSPRSYIQTDSFELSVNPYSYVNPNHLSYGLVILVSFCFFAYLLGRIRTERAN